MNGPSLSTASLPNDFQRQMRSRPFASAPCAAASKDLRLRHDDGLIFGSRLYRATVADYGLPQDWITPDSR